MLTNTISQNAVKVRLMLLSSDRISVEELFEMCGLEIVEFYLAVGWLAREEQLLFSYHEGRVEVELFSQGSTSLADAQELMLK